MTDGTSEALMQNTNQNSQVIDKLILALRESASTHLTVANEIMESDGRKLFQFDHLVFAAIHRSLSLIDGAVVMVERRNPACAIPLLRLQLDSALRLFACSLLDDVHTAVLPMLNGEKLSSLKVRRSRLKSPEHAPGTSEFVSLHDSLLHKEFSLIEPCATNVYQTTSGYIHLSGKHIYTLFTNVSPEDRGIELLVSSPPDVTWKLVEIEEYLEAFLAITRRVLWLAHSWKVQKEKTGQYRAEMAANGDPVAIAIENLRYVD